jgi:hypothetical protein
VRAVSENRGLFVSGDAEKESSRKGGGMIKIKIDKNNPSERS